MVRFRRHAIAAAAILACQSPSEPLPLETLTADLEARSEARLYRPFIGHFEGQLTFVPPFQEGSLDVCNASFSGDPAHPGPSVSAFDNAIGTFSIIGRISLHSSFCFDPDSPDSRGTGVLTARSGEQIFIGFANTAGAPGDDGIVPVQGTQWITGGTGRFENASGLQLCRLAVNALTLRIHGRCEGRIQFADSPARR